jgi:hypothetical protein
MGREYPTASIQFEWNVIGVQALGRHADQNAQGVRLDDLVNDLKVFNQKMFWDVHGLTWSLKKLTAAKTPFSTNPRRINTDKKSRNSEKPDLLTSAKIVRRPARYWRWRRSWCWYGAVKA